MRSSRSIALVLTSLLADSRSGQTFADVPVASTFWLFIERLAGRGLLSGYPGGGSHTEPCDASNRPYFRPALDITRAQGARLVAYTFFGGPCAD